MERYLKSTTIYMVTGILTIFGADTNRTDKQSAKDEGGLDIPLSKLIPGALAFPESKILDLKFKGKTWDSQKSLVSFVAPDERVLAVQYRRVAFKAFASKTVGEARLKKGKWKVMDGEKDRDNAGDIKDIVEAILEDVMIEGVKGDLECDEDDIWVIEGKEGDVNVFAFAAEEGGKADEQE
jgi:hypothetical protein